MLKVLVVKTHGMLFSTKTLHALVNTRDWQPQVTRSSTSSPNGLIYQSSVCPSALYLFGSLFSVLSKWLFFCRCRQLLKQLHDIVSETISHTPGLTYQYVAAWFSHEVSHFHCFLFSADPWLDRRIIMLGSSCTTTIGIYQHHLVSSSSFIQLLLLRVRVPPLPQVSHSNYRSWDTNCSDGLSSSSIQQCCQGHVWSIPPSWATTSGLHKRWSFFSGVVWHAQLIRWNKDFTKRFGDQEIVVGECMEIGSRKAASRQLRTSSRSFHQSAYCDPWFSVTVSWILSHILLGLPLFVAQSWWSCRASHGLDSPIESSHY
jgi:hypothetical protein